MRSVVLILIVLLVLIGGWYYVSLLRRAAPADNPATGALIGETNPEPIASTSADTATTTEDDFSVSGYDFGFTPSTLTVHKGDHVQLTFLNLGGLHDLKLDEFGVATPRIETGASTTVQFDATKTGSFQFYSSTGNDRARGMWGTLTVTE